MGKATIILGTGIMALLLAFVGTNHWAVSKETRNKADNMASTYANYANDPYLILDTDFCLLEDVPYIEEYEEIELNFDTKEYLPMGFNAYEGMVFDLGDIEYLEIEDEIELGFNTEKYLPEGFDAYADATLNLDDIIYLEEEEDIELGFNTSTYLPDGFNAYGK